jgi:hypothetical protein
LFTSSVFEGIGGDYFISRKIPDGLFTRLVLEGIIPGYPTNPLHTSVFLARLKNLHHGRVFLERVFVGIGEFWMNTKSLLFPIFIEEKNTGEINKALR